VIGSVRIGGGRLDQGPAGTVPLSGGSLDFSNVGATALTVSLNLPAGGVGPFLYQFRRALDLNGSPGSFQDVGVQSTATSYDDSGLSPLRSYWYECVVTDVGN
jgi:hypothetical protein